MSPIIKRKGEKFTIPGKYLLFILTFLCTAMMLITFGTDVFNRPFNTVFGYVIVPFQQGISRMGSWLVNRSEELVQIRTLLEENERLRNEVAALTEENTLLQQDRYELNQLRELLDLDEQYGEYDKVGARIISRDSGNWYSSFIIDKGTEDGLSVDMNVIAGGGLVGIITSVGPNWARVTSIISDNSNVSAKTLATEDNLIVSGDLQLMADGAECGKQIAVQTEAGVQMPNAGFEEWGTFDGIVSPYSSVETAFWGTGNKGADMAKVILTESSTDIRPGSSGKLSARLESKDAKVLGIGKFAAGNLFVGEFGETDMGSMSGTVKMGRAFEFNAKPQSLNGWFKYTQAGSDKGRIFVCLVNMTNGSTYHTVDTNEDNINGDRINVTALDPMAEFIYADIDNPETLEGHIIGYGDLVLETTVPDWTEFEIPIIYREKYAGEKPNVLIVTASASWRGDYFDGAVGSTMYLDDIEFVY